MIRQIISHLPLSALPAIMRVDRTWYDAAAPHLYRHLLYCTGVSNGDSCRRDPFVGLTNPEGRITRSRASNPCGNLKKRLLAYTEHLQMRFHCICSFSPRCRGTYTPTLTHRGVVFDMPNLRSLQLHSSGTCEAGLDCPLVAQTRPSVLIVDIRLFRSRRRVAGSSRSCEELRPGDHFRNTPHVVHVVEYQHPTYQQNRKRFDPEVWIGFEQTAATQTVTLVIRFPRFQKPFKLPEGVQMGIAMFCAQYISIPITVVGVDELEIWSEEIAVPDQKPEAYVARCRDKVERELVKIVEDVPRRMEDIRLLTARELRRAESPLDGVGCEDLCAPPDQVLTEWIASAGSTARGELLRHWWKSHGTSGAMRTAQRQLSGEHFSGTQSIRRI